MKRLFLIMTLATLLIGTSSFAADDTNVSQTVMNSFQSSFKSATDVNWSVSSSYFKVSFMMSGQSVSAYYNAEGQMMAMTRIISLNQLPLTLQASLKKKYDGFWISDLFEMANEDGTQYYITLENADTTIVLKSSDTDWMQFRKQRKA